MSYKLDWTTLRRDAPTSLTQQIVDRIVTGVDDGSLEPGEKLPTTRELAESAGVNHLTAARAYRRLAEMGYVTATVGRGTFVRAHPPGAAGDDPDADEWQEVVLPARQVSYAEQVLEDSIRLATEPGVLSLAAGFPSPARYPVGDLARIAQEVFETEGNTALGYIPAEGLPELREALASRGRRAGFADSADEIIVVSGARPGIDLVARAILEPGDVCVVEAPTFVGLLTSARATGAQVIGVPYGEDGLDVDALERVLARHEVKLVALQTSCQNPTGQDMSPQRRKRLAQLAVERGFFVLEDGVYSNLRYEGSEQPRLRSLAPNHVIYVDSLSKTVGGGLRLGWIAARGPVRRRLAMLKMDSDIHTSTLVQMIAARYLRGDAHERQLAGSIEFYRERRDALLTSLERHLEGEYRVLRPRGGHHTWVTLRRPVDERALYAQAFRHGVSFTPGGAMTPERPSQTAMRLSFALLDPDEMDEALRRLARAIRAVRREDRSAAALPIS
jgi:2-aminoadipate transaminase